MSQSPPNYVAGVPVKISERFRPPPKITLPQSVTNRLAQLESSGGVLRNIPCYDFKLEETVLNRITEWRAVKERDRYERKERIRLKEQELARLVEEEQKRKLNQISYPNTDDLSSASEDGDDDEPSEENDDSVPSGSSEEQGQRNEPAVVGNQSTAQYGHVNRFDTILIPTVLPELSASKTSTQEKVISSGAITTVNIPKSTSVLNNNNNAYNKINYSDFENDTSSPFDNMELKTMNDLDILAQVLNLNVSNSGSEPSPEESSNEVKANTIEESAKSPPPATHVEEKPMPAVQQQQYGYSQQPQQYAAYQPAHQQTSSSNDYYKPYNSYHYNYCQYAPTSTVSTNCYTPTDSRSPLSQYNSAANTSYQSGTQSQYQPFSQGHVGTSVAYNYYPYTSSASNSSTQPTYAHSYLYNNATYGHQPTLVGSGGSGYNYSAQPAATTADTTRTASFYGTSPFVNSQAEAATSTSIRSKSKSVPDIVRQLDEEVQDSALKRTRNNSQSNAERRQDEEPVAAAATTPSRQDFTFYNQLPLADQNLVKRIGSMGFPLERVAAVLKRIGSDDKKIVEHLIPLSELLDLGFEEERISDALIKCGNNKHKALDELLKS